MHTLNLGVFLKVLQVRGQFLYFINLSDFEAVRVKGAFYSRMCFFVMLILHLVSAFYRQLVIFLLDEYRTHQGHVINNMVSCLHPHVALYIYIYVDSVCFCIFSMVNPSWELYRPAVFGVIFGVECSESTFPIL